MTNRVVMSTRFVARVTSRVGMTNRVEAHLPLPSWYLLVSFCKTSKEYGRRALLKSKERHSSPLFQGTSPSTTFLVPFSVKKP